MARGMVARTNMSAEQIDLLCNHCGQAFSAFLHEMADHNAKVTSCPNCGKVHDVKPPKTAKPVARARPIKKTIKTI
jgi:uncharacterized Zn finger protein